MLVCYILTNRVNKIKIVMKDGEKTFTDKDGFVYNIVSDCVYYKKFFRVKFFRFSQYCKGNPNPIPIQNWENNISNIKLTNINYLAVLLWKLKKLIWEKISVVLLVIVILLQIIGML